MSSALSNQGPKFSEQTVPGHTRSSNPQPYAAAQQSTLPNPDAERGKHAPDLLCGAGGIVGDGPAPVAQLHDGGALVLDGHGVCEHVVVPW